MSDSISYGLGEGGFVRLRMPEILAEIASDFKNRTGYDMDLTPDSLIGQLANITAEREARLWELAERVFLSAYPVTATGAALDLAVSYAGVRRILATPSDARAVFVGDQGTVVPAGSIVESTQLIEGLPSPPRFYVKDDVVISRDQAAQLTLRVAEPIVVGAEYWIDWQTFRATVTADALSTGASIAEDLKDQLLAFDATASQIGNTVSISSSSQFLASWSSSIEQDLLGSPGTLVCEDTGPIPAPAGSLVTIITPVSGWQLVSNINAARLGTDYESDAELRQRYETGVYRLGSGTPAAILANLRQDIVGASSVAVYENTGDTTNGDGMPPHSVEVVIEGGDDLTVAQRIYDLKPAGIASHGNTTQSIVDSSGYTETVKFSRPERRQIWLKATVTTTSEEVIPGDLLERVRAALVDYGNTLGVGENVYLQRLVGAVFRATTGVASVVLTAAATAEGAPTPAAGSYTNADIAISTRQRAVFRTSSTNVV